MGEGRKLKGWQLVDELKSTPLPPRFDINDISPSSAGTNEAMDED